MDSLVSTAILVLVAVTSFAIVISIGMPLVDKALDSVKVDEAVSFFRYAENYINDITTDGSGSVRSLKFRTSSGGFDVSSRDDSISMEIDTGAKLMDDYSRSLSGNFLKISGNDVSCSNETNITMENSYIKFVLRSAAPLSAINTSNIIINITEKRSGKTITPSDSSITIDSMAETSHGIGFAELTKSGNSLPLCTVHAYINSTLNYDIYYTLYAGADFLSIEVRNIA